MPEMCMYNDYLKYLWHIHKFKSITYTKNQDKFTSQ